MRLIKFNKPFEVLSKFTDREGRSTLRDFIPIRDVYPIGRLDYRSEGLLLLSDYGKLTQKLSDPRHKYSKTYLVQVEGVITSDGIEILKKNIVLPNFQTRLPLDVEHISSPRLPSRSKPVRNYHPTSWIKIILTEGKKHQVRRMTAAVGFPTLRLVRVAIGAITIQNLSVGEWKDLSSTEKQLILE